MFTEEALARLGELGQVVRGDGTSDEIAADLPELLENADVAVTGWGAPPIPAELFGPRLKLVAHAAGSVKRLVPEEVVARGVVVSHAASVIADAVCEFALGLILVGLRRPHEMDAAMRAGAGWREAAFARPRQLAGRPVGVVGAGYVGRRVIAMLRALRAEVLVYDPYLKDDLGARPVGLDGAVRPERRRDAARADHARDAPHDRGRAPGQAARRGRLRQRGALVAGRPGGAAGRAAQGPLLGRARRLRPGAAAARQPLPRACRTC